MMYRPWVTVNMVTGEEVDELPDQTKGLWSQQFTVIGRLALIHGLPRLPPTCLGASQSPNPDETPA